jgi:hypothetical protein
VKAGASRVGALLAWCAVSVFAQSGAESAAFEARLSKDAAAAFEKKLQTLEGYEKNPRIKRAAVRVSEDEVNSYVNLSLRDSLPRGVTQLRATLREGGLQLRGFADLSQLGDTLPASGGGSLLSFFAGPVSVELVANFRSGEGFGQFDLVSAQVGPVALTPAMVADIVLKSTKSRTRPDGFDVRTPFRLPYESRRIRALPGAAIVEY